MALIFIGIFVGAMVFLFLAFNLALRQKKVMLILVYVLFGIVAMLDPLFSLRENNGVIFLISGLFPAVVILTTGILIAEVQKKGG